MVGATNISKASVVTKESSGFGRRIPRVDRRSRHDGSHQFNANTVATGVSPVVEMTGETPVLQSRQRFRHGEIAFVITAQLRRCVIGIVIAQRPPAAIGDRAQHFRLDSA